MIPYLITPITDVQKTERPTQESTGNRSLSPENNPEKQTNVNNREDTTTDEGEVPTLHTPFFFWVL